MISPAARAKLTPTGKLRVGISFGNELLTDPSTLQHAARLIDKNCVRSVSVAPAAAPGH